MIVAAAGNDGNKKPVNYPGAYSGVTAVSASTEKTGSRLFPRPENKLNLPHPAPILRARI
ncbi:S8 family serine peptidase [Bacillus velezensis]|nr:S8 family serine peptidase [Bacillus velezensis]